MTEPTDSTAGAIRSRSGRARAGDIAAELACAVGSAAVSLAAQQKAAAAAAVGNVGEAVRAAARSLESSHNPRAADYAGRVAEEIAALGAALGERGWDELVAAADAIGRRRPALFVGGAAFLGFLAGRLWAATPPAEPAAACGSDGGGNSRRDPPPAGEAREPP